uniref:Uncharacterized protein n=1 Tax=Rhizophora mucronata TaxID=61149 RepID=A0A2P2J0J3_RHIMU
MPIPLMIPNFNPFLKSELRPSITSKSKMGKKAALDIIL